MGWKTWGRERLPATDLQQHLQDQVIIHAASASAFSAMVPDSARKDGMVRWLDDVERGEYFDADASTWRYAFGNPPAPTLLPLAANWRNHERTPGTPWERLTLTERGTSVSLRGFVSAINAFNGLSLLVDPANIPARLRPADELLRIVHQEVATARGLYVRPATGIFIDASAAAGAWFVVNVSWNAAGL